MELILLCYVFVFYSACSDSQGNQYEGSSAIAGLLQSVRIDLIYNNIGPHPALGSEVLFTLPEGFAFSQASVPKDSLPVSVLQFCLNYMKENMLNHPYMISSYWPFCQMSHLFLVTRHPHLLVYKLRA